MKRLRDPRDPLWRLLVITAIGGIIDGFLGAAIAASIAISVMALVEIRETTQMRRTRSGRKP